MPKSNAPHATPYGLMAVAVLAAALSACGGRGSITQPSGLEPGPRRNGQGAATVTSVPNSPHATSQVAPTVTAERSGAQVQASVAPDGDFVVITAPGFLPRRQLASLPQATLWEDDSVLPYTVTYSLVYSTVQRLLRPRERALTVSVDPALLATPRFREALDKALQTLSSQTPYSITLTEGPAYAEMTLVGQAGGLTYLDVAGSSITHARIQLGGLDAFWGDHLQRVITHELGHTLGLGDCDFGKGMMCDPNPVLDFSSQEQEVLRKMTERTAGNAPPDNDAGVSGSSTLRRQVCSFVG